MVHADRMLALLGERRVVDDPRLDRTGLLDRRQHHLTYLGQHVLIRPCRKTNKVQQRLVLRRRPPRSRPRCHRLDAFALARQHQTSAIIAQLPRTPRVTDDARKLIDIDRKPRFDFPVIVETHLALRAPKYESLQILDSQV
jgi:hypothetical protein